MNDKTTKRLLLTLVALVLGGTIYFLTIDSTETSDNSVETGQNNSSGNTDKVVLTDGKISGSFTYPSEAIPSTLSACVEDAESRELVTCSDAQIKDDSRFIYGTGYEVAVPAGDYFVYVQEGDNKSYFNGYVAGVTKEDGWPDYDTDKCDSAYQPIVVTVDAGKTTDNITLADWYYENSCN